MIVAFLNRKGGVGKTSSVFHLSGALAAAGFRVLVVDNDPQASLTQAFFGPDRTRNLPLGETIYPVLAGDRPSVEAIARPTDCPGVDILPGALSVDDLNLPVDKAAPDAPSLLHLSNCLAAATGYDFILIDCPPNVAACSASALLAASSVVVPVMPEDPGAQGIFDVEAAIGWARSGANPGLAIAGFLVTMMQAQHTVHKHYLNTIRLAKGTAVFEEVVPRSVIFPEAIMERTPVTRYAPKHAAAVALRRVADEFVRRVSPGLPGVGALDRAAATASNGEAL